MQFLVLICATAQFICSYLQTVDASISRALLKAAHVLTMVLVPQFESQLSCTHYFKVEINNDHFLIYKCAIIQTYSRYFNHTPQEIK